MKRLERRKTGKRLVLSKFSVKRSKSKRGSYITAQKKKNTKEEKKKE